MDGFQPLVPQKQTSAIQISSRLASLHSSFLLHFQRSSLAIFHCVSPAHSPNVALSSARACYVVLFLSVSLHYSHFVPRSCFSSHPATTSLSLLNFYFSRFLVFPLSPPSISSLPPSLPASVCQARSPSPALMDFVIYGQERNPWWIDVSKMLSNC